MLSPHLALVANMAITKPVRSSALKAVFRCCKRRRDEGLVRSRRPGRFPVKVLDCDLELGTIYPLSNEFLAILLSQVVLVHLIYSTSPSLVRPLRPLGCVPVALSLQLLVEG